MSWLGERVVADLREAVYARVIRMDPGFFEVTRTGEVLSRLTADTTLVQSIAGVNLSITLRSAISVVGSLVMLAVTSLKLTALIVVLIPLLIVPLIVLGRRVRKLSRTSQDRIADTSGLADETLNAIQTVQAFTLEALNSRRYRRRGRGLVPRGGATDPGAFHIDGDRDDADFRRHHVRAVGRRARGDPRRDDRRPARASSCSTRSTSRSPPPRSARCGARCSGPRARWSGSSSCSTPSRASWRRRIPCRCPCRGAASIRFDRVSFRYPSRPDAKALDAFDLVIRPGETIAFVGPSGAGKSTTFQLLLRFYDPESGRILIDGIDIANADPQDVRRRIGLVPQDTVLFGGQRAREHPLRPPGRDRCRDRGGGTCCGGR